MDLTEEERRTLTALRNMEETDPAGYEVIAVAIKQCFHYYSESQTEPGEVFGLLEVVLKDMRLDARAELRPAIAKAIWTVQQLNNRR